MTFQPHRQLIRTYWIMSLKNVLPILLKMLAFLLWCWLLKSLRQYRIQVGWLTTHTPYLLSVMLNRFIKTSVERQVKLGLTKAACEFCSNNIVGYKIMRTCLEPMLLKFCHCKTEDQEKCCCVKKIDAFCSTDGLINEPEFDYRKLYQSDRNKIIDPNFFYKHFPFFFYFSQMLAAHCRCFNCFGSLRTYYYFWL